MRGIEVATGAVSQLLIGPAHAIGVPRLNPSDRLHLLEHLAGEVEVEQRVDEQRVAVADDQPGVAVAPLPARLQIGPEPVAELVQTLGVLDAHAVIAPRDHSRPGIRILFSGIASEASLSRSCSWRG
jgi:hypothetical protein